VVLHRRLLASLAGAALAVSLGACSDGVRGGLPEDDASVLQREIEDVREAVEGERCTDIEGQVRQVNERLDNLPTSVSDRLEQSLRDGVARLSDTAVNECNALTVPEIETQPEEPPATQEEPAPEEETPAPEEETPAPGEETPPEEPTDPAPDPETPAPETPEGGTPAPEGGTPEGTTP
jgi:hypothetical protein